MALVADAATLEADEAAESATETLAPARFHALIVVTGVPTGDNRMYEKLTWRDLPWPLMATDKTSWGHEDAVLIGNFDTIEVLNDNEYHGWGDYLANPEGDAARLIALAQSGELRGISADLDDMGSYDVIFPAEDADPFSDAGMTVEEDEDGNEVIVMSITEPMVRVPEARIMGATLVPFPAFQEASMLEGNITASGVAAIVNARADKVTGALIEEALPLTAAAATATDAPTSTTPLPGRESAPTRFDFPAIPPRSWFEVEESPGPMPLTIMDDGQVFGHLAVWGECHIGFAGECIEPPPSASNYARFHVGEIPVDDGRVSVGRLTFHTGHAAKHLGAEATIRHYDDTGTVAADLRARDGEYGIWVCGAMRSTLSIEQVREVMASPPSGDWRRFGRDLELVGALCVNVPGFNTPRLTASGSPQKAGRWASVRMEDDEVQTLIASNPAAPTVLVASSGLSPEVSRSVIDRLARSIGRTPEARIAELATRVHGGK